MTEELADILNELLVAEGGALARQVTEAGVYVPLESVHDALMLERMVAEGRDRERKIARWVASLGGVPRPRIERMSAAGLGFQDLDSLWPCLVQDEQSLVNRYSRALVRVGSHPSLSPMLQRMLDQHRADVERLSRHLGVQETQDKIG